MAIASALKPESGILASRLAAGDAFSVFNRRLKVVLADSEDLLDIVFRLRFQVYCIERGFESAAEFTDGREIDRDDARSLHALLIDRSSGIAIGTVRLILPRQGDELPVFRVAGSDRCRAAGLPFATTAEVSRFAITKSFRRSFEDNCWLAANRSRASARADGAASQLLLFGLIRSVVVMTSRARVSHIVGMMEPALLRLLARLGIVFHPIGEPVQHHGVRQPGWAAITFLNLRVKNFHPLLWEIGSESRQTAAQKADCAHA